MNVFEAIRAHLAGYPAVSIVAGARVYHGERPQNSALPAVAFDETGGGEPILDMAGQSIGLARAPISIECYAADAGTAHSLRDAVRAALESWINSPMGGAGGVYVWSCDQTGQSGFYEPDTQTIIREVSFDVMYSE